MPGLDSLLEQVRKASDADSNGFVKLLIDEAVRRQVAIIKSRVGKHMCPLTNLTDYEIQMREYVRCKVTSHRIWKGFWVKEAAEYAEMFSPLDTHSLARYLSRRSSAAHRAAKASLEAL